MVNNEWVFCAQLADEGLNGRGGLVVKQSMWLIQGEIRNIKIVNKTFQGVSFKGKFFSQCLFENVRFINCDFTECNFENTKVRKGDKCHLELST